MVLANVDDIEDLVVLAKSFSQEYCDKQHEEEADIDNIDDLTMSCKISYAPIIDKEGCGWYWSSLTHDAFISQGLLQRFFRRRDPVPLGNSRSTFLSIFDFRDHIAFSFVLLKMIDNNNYLDNSWTTFIFGTPIPPTFQKKAIGGAS